MEGMPGNLGKREPELRIVRSWNSLWILISAIVEALDKGWVIFIDWGPLMNGECGYIFLLAMSFSALNIGR